ncbi:hypothetical protein ACFWFR_05090 [Oerskovia sp. NPDC060287]|uniref:hypothetical protein n=1 Tax=Oerskovia sp. NPDC060287 TaxID=3347095 RepID=UPI00364E256A
MDAPSIDRARPDQGLVRPRTGAVLLAVAGVLFLAFPLLRPWVPEDVATPELATAFASGRWIAAHLCGAAGFLLLPAVLLALREKLVGTRGQAPASGAVVTSWLGAGSSCRTSARRSSGSTPSRATRSRRAAPTSWRRSRRSGCNRSR